jgi:hypothetical protein
MKTSADQRSDGAREETSRPYPVLTITDYKLEQSVVRPLARALGVNPVSCTAIPLKFGEHLLDQLYAPLGSRSKFSGYVDGRNDEPRRIALKVLLDNDYRDGARDNHHETPLRPSDEPHVVLSRAVAHFARGTTTPELRTLLQNSDLTRVVLPVVDTFINDEQGYLTQRIPPHVGHGVSRRLCFAKPEVIEAEKEAEAQQDRGSASNLLTHLKSFLTSGDTQDFVHFMRTFNTCGDWLWWIAAAPKHESAHAQAEQVIAHTVVRLLKFKEFTREYEQEFMTPGRVQAFVRWQWCEPCLETRQIVPLAYPLLASALAILTQAEFKHL